jgi:hypothetical protein
MDKRDLERLPEGEGTIPFKLLADFLMEQSVALEGNKVLIDGTAQGVDHLARNAYNLGQLDMLTKLGVFIANYITKDENL